MSAQSSPKMNWSCMWADTAMVPPIIDGPFPSQPEYSLTSHALLPKRATKDAKMTPTSTPAYSKLNKPQDHQISWQFKWSIKAISHSQGLHNGTIISYCIQSPHCSHNHRQALQMQECHGMQKGSDGSTSQCNLATKQVDQSGWSSVHMHGLWSEPHCLEMYRQQKSLDVSTSNI